MSTKIDCGKWERCLRDVEKKSYYVNKMQSATLFVRMQEHEKIIERKEAISKKRRISLYSLWALPGQIYS
ncbi:MAG TPA: hypothetical protein VE619_11795 [Nitrososphaeraceae archaeon]|nr:hypothetical protein [Nitrososphaeraceae archaeon]